MKRSIARSDSRSSLERSYASALGKHVTPPSVPGGGVRIGRRARKLGVGALALARIHDRAAAALTPAHAAADGAAAGRGDARIALEESFFAEAVAAVGGEMRRAPSAPVKPARLTAALARREAQLAAARARIVREVERRAATRTELDATERRYRACLGGAQLTEERLRRLSHRLLDAQEAERMRISRDLHDAIGQTLTGINVGLAALKNEATAGSRGLAEAISLTQKLVERSMKTVHQFAWELRPTLLDDLGLVPALRSYSRTFAVRTGIPVRFTADAKVDRLSEDGRTALFRVAQGALSNVERHARAGRASVVLRTLPGLVRLEVRDNGVAFDVERMMRSRGTKHLGLIVMRERVEMVGGAYWIESTPGRGTFIRAEVPIEAAPRD